MATHTEVLNGLDLDLREVAQDVVARAMKSGATAAEAIVRSLRIFHAGQVGAG